MIYALGYFDISDISTKTNNHVYANRAKKTNIYFNTMVLWKSGFQKALQKIGNGKSTD